MADTHTMSSSAEGMPIAQAVMGTSMTALYTVPTVGEDETEAAVYISCIHVASRQATGGTAGDVMIAVAPNGGAYSAEMDFSPASLVAGDHLCVAVGMYLKSGAIVYGKSAQAASATVVGKL